MLEPSADTGMLVEMAKCAAGNAAAEGRQVTINSAHCAPKPEKRRGPKSASTAETRQARDWKPVSELVVETGPVEPAADAASSAADTGPYAL